MKKLSFFIVIVLTFGFLLSYDTFAKNISLTGFINNDVISITVIDSKQPNIVWDLPEKDINELVLLFENIVLNEEAAMIKSNQKYILYINTWDGITPVSIYNNGLLVISEDIESSKAYNISDYANFSNSLNKILTTQSKGYGNKQPSKGALVEVSEWAASTYQKAIENELIPEYMKIGYMTDSITREQFCDLISILLKKQNIHDEIFNKEMNFNDTNNENVNYLVQRNIIMGKSDINFAPNDFLTREEAATILCRTLGYLGINTTVETEHSFIDDTTISDWAKEEVYKVSKLGFMIGTDENTFSPQQTFNKEQAIATVLRIFEEHFLIE